jgi:hypothetical protein
VLWQPCLEIEYLQQEPRQPWISAIPKRAPRCCRRRAALGRLRRKVSDGHGHGSFRTIPSIVT